MMNLKTLFFALYFCIVFVKDIESNTISNAEISALHDIYTLNNGQQWTWKSPYYIFGQEWNFSQVPLDPCGWQGVACANITHNKLAIITVTLQNYDLNGIIPPSIYNLSSLLFFELDGNKIHGSIPNEICHLRNLTVLSLGENQLTGTLPSCLFQSLTKLEAAIFAINQLHGPIPSFPNIQNYYLVYLALESNMFTGTVPPSIVHAKYLSILYLGVNKLNGPIEFLGELTSLQRLSLNTNSFHGTVPTSLGNLTSLQYLYLHVNQFYGTLPSTLSNLIGLIYFTTYENSFTGTLPAGFEQFVNMQTFIIDDNYHTGTLPSYIGDWSNLQQLVVYDNYFSGLLPSSLSQLSKITLLLLQENWFSGTPAMAFNRTIQTELKIVDIASNEFTGEMPIEIFGKSLQAFSSFETCFTGGIPNEICDATSLESLSLDGMRSKCSYPIWKFIKGSPRYASPVKGTIPECMWTNFRNLTMFHASSNGLTGTIPPLDNYGNLTDLDLSFNSLHGTIPFTLQSWKKLINFDLQNNKLSGDISGLAFLQYSYSNEVSGVSISLSKNRLSGIIPWAVQSAENIDLVDGNLFSCSMKHQPPYKDKKSNNYVCGSNLLDISLYSFLSIGIVVTLFVVFVIYSIQSRLLWRITNHKVITSTIENFCRNCRITIILLNNHQLLSQYLQTLRRELDGMKTKSTAEDDGPHPPPSTWFLEIKFNVFLMLWWRSKVLHFLKNEHQEKELFPYLYQFLVSVQILRNISVLTMLMIVAITLPLFGTLKEYFGTYKIQYRWTLSGAFLSGYEPSAAIIGLWLVILIPILILLQIYVPMRLEQQFRTLSSFPSSSTLTSDNNEASRKDSGISSTTNTIDPRASFFDSISDKLQRATKVTRASLAVKTVSTAVKYVQKRSVWVSMLALVGNIVIVLVLKAAIISLLVASDTSFGIKVLLEICLSGVDLIYGAIIVPYIINNLPHDSSTGRMILKTVMLFINSVLAPCIVIALADASCFEGALVGADSVDETFTFTSCIVYSDSNKDICEKTTSWQSIRPYTPTFLYNYNCYSTILIAYIPIFMISYSFLTLTIPFVSMLVLYRKRHWFFMNLFPGVYYVTTTPTDQQVTATKTKHPMIAMENWNVLHKVSSGNNVLDISLNSYKSNKDRSADNNSVDTDVVALSTDTEKTDTLSLLHRPAIFPAFILASTMHHLLVLLTFGAMCPSLSVTIAVVNVTTSLTWETLIGRWLMRDDPISPASPGFLDVCFQSHTPYFGSYTKQIDQSCESVCCAPRKCFGLLIFGSGIFYALGTLDMAADKQGWKQALWAPVLVMGLCVVLFLTFNHDLTMFKSYFIKQSTNNGIPPGIDASNLHDTNYDEELNNDELIHNRIHQSDIDDVEYNSYNKQRVVSMSIEQQESF